MGAVVEEKRNGLVERPVHSAGRSIHIAAVAFALGGGLLLIGLLTMSLISITGRKLFATPIQGDIELMQMGMAVACAAFLPICELDDEHIRVAAFTSWLPERHRRNLELIAHILLGLMFTVLTWRTALAAVATYESGEFSTLLSIPMWIPMMLLLPSLFLTVLCAVYRVVLLITRAVDV